MKLFEGKSPTERNKIIAALVLGAMAVLAILYNIVGLYPSGKTIAAVTVSTSPSPTASPKTDADIAAAFPSQADINLEYLTEPVFYNPGASNNAPDAGRNIFAFYEPGAPGPYIAPPPVVKTPAPLPPATPQPTPPLLIAFVAPQTVYAGSQTFHLEVGGDKFTPDSVILFGGNPLPTTFVSPQKLTAEVPSNFIAGEGGTIVTVATPDGKLSSNQFAFAIQAPPRPQFQYIGMIGRKRGNNDTAYFLEREKQTPFGARLKDVVGGRFRVESISPNEVIFEDVNLHFRHRLALYRPAPGQQGGAGGGGNPNPNQIYNQYPGGIQPYGIPQQQYIPPPQQQQKQKQSDTDDDGDN